MRQGVALRNHAVAFPSPGGASRVEASACLFPFPSRASLQSNISIVSDANLPPFTLTAMAPTCTGDEETGENEGCASRPRQLTQGPASSSSTSPPTPRSTTVSTATPTMTRPTGSSSET